MHTDPTSLDHALDDLKALGDELRVKAHLAGLDLATFLEAREPELRRLQQRVKAASDEVRTHGPQLEQAARALLDEVSAAFREARDRLRGT